jgi:thioredoxin-like negative regulator of GroEL
MNDQSRLKFWGIAGAIVFALTVGGWFARPAYRHFKEQHSAKQAEIFFARADYRNAFLSVRQALLFNSNNVPACRIMARLLDLGQSPAALAWQQRVVDLEPNVTNKLMLASEGLQHQDPPFPLTTQILNALSSSATNLVEYQVIATELALRLNRMADAQAHLELALQLQPTNRQFQVNLATLQLGATNPVIAETGRGKLKKFLADTNFAAQALRSLVSDRLAQKDLPAALNYSTQLTATAQVTVGDGLQQLDILQTLHTDLSPQLKFTQQLAATNAAAAAAVASWMVANGRVTDAANWLNHLPPDVQSQLPARLALVDCYLANKDWQALMNFTSKGDWRDAEFLRKAFLSHGLSELGISSAAETDWEAAVESAGERPGSLVALADLAGRWDLEPEHEDLLWQIVRKFPKGGNAGKELEQVYFRAGDTRKLNELYGTLLAAFPQNIDIKNNLTATALLLKTNLPQAYLRAKENYDQKPDDPSVVSTYAYALDLQGRTREGLAVMEKLEPASLEKSSIALYYGVLLTATGETDKGAHFFQLAQTQGGLLPEEKVLIKISH